MSPSKKLPSEVATSGNLAIVGQLHAPMKPASRSKAIEHQLRTGIAIGVLEAGTRLPNEQIMARHMGVSALTFRQALDQLREHRLVSTRPGRGGGTFINASLSTLEELAKEALSEISLAEIADLSHSVAELYAAAARLAAQRRDENDITELKVSLARLIEPMTPVERRRASTLYVITIARIARSETLLAALVPLIGEFQLLAWTEHVNGLVVDLNQAAAQTVDAVLRAAPEDAADAARKNIQLVSRHIVSDRAQLFATHTDPDDLTPREAFQNLLGDIHQIQDSLKRGRQQLAALEVPRFARASPSDKIDAILRDIATNNSELLRGTGVAYAPGMLNDARLWMDWWDSDYGLELTFKSHDFNARSLQYYDYEHMQWFTQPLRTGEFSLVGPYLDRGGIETSTITVSLPITNGPFAGCVLGADLHIPGIEHRLLQNSRATAQHHVLVNADNRVLVSTSPYAMHGTLLDPKDTEHYEVVAQENGRSIAQWQLLKVRGDSETVSS